MAHGVALRGTEAGQGATGRGYATTARALAEASDAQAFAAGEAQLLALAAAPDTLNVDEECLHRLLQQAHACLYELSALSPARPEPRSALAYCIAWLHFAGSGGLAEGAEGLRGPAASRLAFSAVRAALAVAGESPSRLASAAMLPAFLQSRGLYHFGRALCCVDDTMLMECMGYLHETATRCGRYARLDRSGMAECAADIDAFRGDFVNRIRDMACRPGRSTRVKDFKKLVSEFGSVLSVSGAHDTTQVFEMVCVLSLELTKVLAQHCPGVPEPDALEAVDWMSKVMRNLLDQPAGAGGRQSSAASSLREWVTESDIWDVLLQFSGCKTQLHLHSIFGVLVTRRAVSPRELIEALNAAGAFGEAAGPSRIAAPSRLATQSALLMAMPPMGAEVAATMCVELCHVLDFPLITAEDIDLLARATQRALSAGADPGQDVSRALAVPHLLRYIQWATQQPEPPLELLEHVHRELLQGLITQPALAPLLPSIAAEALSLALGCGPLANPLLNASSLCAGRCVRSLGMFAVDVCRASAAFCGGASASAENASRLSKAALAKLCGALPPIGFESPLEDEGALMWVATLVDALACYLRLPGAQIATEQVGTLWSRMIVRPVLGLPVTKGALQYFKLAFLAQTQACNALLAPFLICPNPPAEIRMAYSTIFCPPELAHCPAPLDASFFLPTVGGFMGAAAPDGGAALLANYGYGSSLSRMPAPFRRSLSSSTAFEDLLGLGPCVPGAESAEDAAAAIGIELPATSAQAPRLQLDRIHNSERGHGTSLFGELTVYNAIERRLWDEFDQHGRVEDADAVAQRDGLAVRCLDALNAEVDDAGRAGRDLPAPLAEARAKFSCLCELIRTGGARRTRADIQESEASFVAAEEAFLAAKSAHQLAAVRARRRGRVEVNEGAQRLHAATANFARARVELIASLRRLASLAQTGLVEVIGAPGLGRALRAIGAQGHGDALLDRVAQHRPWVAAQAEDDAEVADSEAEHMAVALSPPRTSASPSRPHAVSHAASFASSPSRPSVAALPTAAEVRRALAKPEGLEGYTGLKAVVDARGRGGAAVLVARRAGLQVALKIWARSPLSEAACQRELRALAALRQACIVPLNAVFAGPDGSTYLELAWCAGGTLLDWRARHPGVPGAEDVEACVRCMGLFRQVLHAVDYVHGRGAIHGDLSLSSVLLTSGHRPVLADFKRCILDECEVHEGALLDATPGYLAPELEGNRGASPTRAGDVYAVGVAMAKAFLDLDLEVSACPYLPDRGQRSLPDEKADVDLADLLQAALAQDPGSRPSAGDAANHRALDPAQLLRRRGLLPSGRGGRGGGWAAKGTSQAEVLLVAAEQLREEYRGRRVDEPLMFSRASVFEAIAGSRVSEWTEDALLGEWRVMLSDESGVDGGGLRREVISLFFEQLAESRLVVRAGECPTLFVADRQSADLSVQQWRQMWASIGAIVLRSVVHFGNAPVAVSSIVFDCAFGRIGKLPPDEGGDHEEAADGGIAQMLQLREARGDEWARSELLDWLRRLRRADPAKEASYRWMLAQRQAEAANGGDVWAYTLSDSAVQTMEAMLEIPSYKLLMQSSHRSPEGSFGHVGAVLEWVLLWDVYLKFIGTGDRWVAYEAFCDGLTARGRRRDLWSPLTGEQVVDALEGAALTPDVVIDNLEFKPSYGYDTQIAFFRTVLEGFSADELTKFLRFATGIGRLPASKRFPSGQKLNIRFIPDNLDRLPSAHTCFWVVDVPPYEGETEMNIKLRQAIAAPQPFALS